MALNVFLSNEPYSNPWFSSPKSLVQLLKYRVSTSPFLLPSLHSYTFHMCSSVFSASTAAIAFTLQYISLNIVFSYFISAFDIFTINSLPDYHLFLQRNYRQVLYHLTSLLSPVHLEFLPWIWVPLLQRKANSNLVHHLNKQLTFLNFTSHLPLPSFL